MLSVLQDLKDRDHTHISEWVGEDFDPDEFSVDARQPAAPADVRVRIRASTWTEQSTFPEGWFHEGMNRVSGWYRRQTPLIIFAIGAVVAVSPNASTVHVVQDLWRDDALRYAIAQEAWP